MFRNPQSAAAIIAKKNRERRYPGENPAASQKVFGDQPMWVDSGFCLRLSCLNRVSQASWLAAPVNVGAGNTQNPERQNPFRLHGYPPDQKIKLICRGYLPDTIGGFLKRTHLWYGYEASIYEFVTDLNL